MNTWLQAGRLVGAGRHRGGRGLQRQRTAAAAVLDHHAKAAGIADAGHRRRLDHEDERFLDRGELAEQRSGDGGGRLLGIAGALLPRLQGEKDGAGIGSIGEGRAGEADEIDAVLDARRAEREIDRPAMDLVGARQRRARRQLDHDDEIAAVDLRDEADRGLAELVEAVRDDADIDEQHDHGVANHARLVIQAVEVAQPIEAPVEQP